MELESKSYSTLRNKKTCGGLPQTKRYPASIHIYAWKQSASETRVLPRVKQVKTFIQKVTRLSCASLSLFLMCARSLALGCPSKRVLVHRQTGGVRGQ